MLCAGNIAGHETHLVSAFVEDTGITPTKFDESYLQLVTNDIDFAF